MSKLAFDGLVEDKAAFPDCSDLDMDITFLDLMTIFKGFISSGEELSYQFLHLTIQEFLAASQLSDGELLKFFHNHLSQMQYRIALLFLAGISHLKFDSIHFKLHYTFTSNEFLFFAHLISAGFTN